MEQFAILRYNFFIFREICHKHEGIESKIGKALGNKNKEMYSIVIYVLGVILSFVFPILGIVCYALVAIIWLIPDPRIEKQLK